MLICEDVWFAEPVAATKAAGAEMMVVPNASPYDFQKLPVRYDVVRARVAESGLPVLYAHMTGGQDELLFDGASFAINADGSVGYQAPEFAEMLGLVDFTGGKFSGEVAQLLSVEASVYRALVVALRDYVNKNGFPGVLLGLSGGVDSAITLAIAVDALGRDRVHAVMMGSALRRKYRSTMPARWLRFMVSNIRKLTLRRCSNNSKNRLPANLPDARKIRQKNIFRRGCAARC